MKSRVVLGASFVALACVGAQTGCRPHAGDGFRSGAAISALSDLSGESELATWTCTGDPCPWGDELSNHVLAWPAAAAPVAARLGYTTSPAVYLPAASANGVTIALDAGSAAVFAGQPFASSHSFLASISAGQSFQVSGLDPDEVLSVQSGDGFAYHVTQTPPEDLPDAGVPVDAGTAPDAAPDGPVIDAGPPPDGASIASQTVSWTCTGNPCPWGQSLTGEALVWPDAPEAIATRLGYTVSAAMYLPAGRANGADIFIVTGEARVHAGVPGEPSHRQIATISAGEALHLTGLASREVLSVQSDDPFSYKVVLPPPSDPDPEDDPGGDPVVSIQGFWRCNIASCSGADWTGAIIAWPAWAAYQDNARPGDMSRSVFSPDGAPLYTYMGPWAQGCEVTAESGTVLIIEWQRGMNSWRETWLYPGQTHVINLVPPENGAMIESYDGSPGFTASLRNCTPQPLQP